MVGFLRDETGATTVDWVVLTAAIMGTTIAVNTVVSGGVESQSEQIAMTLAESDAVFQSHNFGRDATETALAADLDSYGDAYVKRRMDRLMNDMTEEQVVRAHRNWSRAAANPNHRNHAKAADQLVLINTAMASRGISPSGGAGPVRISAPVR